MQAFGGGFSFGPLERLRGKVRGRSAASGLALGAVYGFAGFCAGPILGAVLTIAAASGGTVRGASLLAVYALGIALPLFLMALLWDRLDLGRRGWLRGREVGVGALRFHTSNLLSGATLGISSRHADLQRTAPPMNRQIREVPRDTANRAPGPLRNKEKGSTGEAVQPAVYAHLSRPRHANAEYVHLVVHVFPDTFALVEPDQVDVEIAALPEAPDNTRSLLGGGQYLCNLCAVFLGQSRSRFSTSLGAPTSFVGPDRLLYVGGWRMVDHT